MNRRAAEAMRVFGVEAPVTVPVAAALHCSAPAGADRPGARRSAPDRHLRRADRVADARRDDRAPQPHSRAQGEGRRRSLHFPSPRRGQSRRRRGDGAARRQAGGDAARGRARASRHGAADGRARSSGPLPAASARADRRAGFRSGAFRRRGLRRGRELQRAAGRNPRLCRTGRSGADRALRGVVRPAQGRRAKSASTAPTQQWRDARAGMRAGARLSDRGPQEQGPACSRRRSRPT